MSFVKHERWTEAEIDALPPGEHDYFDRKSGLLFNQGDDLFGALAKALSAFANSGGGHLILGVTDEGVPDGVPTHNNRTPIKDWLEQKIPHLLSYSLADFRVHIAERSNPSRIPANREIVVIDIGDSALAPHQCAYGGGEAKKYFYYYRQAGQSAPAPHFHLELLRQRLVSPVLESKLVTLTPGRMERTDEGIFLTAYLQFRVENVGRVAAYKWQLDLVEVAGHPKNRSHDYRFRRQDYPAGMTSGNGGIRVDDTILPGCSLDEPKDFGVLLKPADQNREAVLGEVNHLLSHLVIAFRVATETSPGEIKRVALSTVLNAQELADRVLAALQHA